MSRKRAALSLATNGFEVFPIAPGGKAPPLVRFTTQATSDPVAVGEWWREHPHANIGVRPGGGTIIVDTDTPAASRLVAELGIPATTEVKTPRGGRHLYLLGEAGTRTAVRPGLDVRGRNGYAIGPGSEVNGRSYEWVLPPWEVAPQPAPAALLELLRERSKTRAMDGGAIPEGRRTTSLVQIAGWFVGKGISGDALDVALRAVNRARCKPCLTEPEVDKILKSANKWDAPPMWILDPLGFCEDARLDFKGRWVLMTLAQRAGPDGTVWGGGWLEQTTSMSRNSISRAVRDLERLGRITVQRKPKQANLYSLAPFPDV